jgi:uncharacterized membrane protein YgdD (TMEM256/DUF423 family)
MQRIVPTIVSGRNIDMYKILMISGAAFAALAVAMGAFGAHGLRAQLSAEMLAVYKTAADYHMYHALGLVLAGIVLKLFPTSTLLVWAGVMMMAGILLFSGSLYILSITGIRWLGAITPFGGTAFILAWVFMALGLMKHA